MRILTSCKLSLEITKNNYYTSNVWCSVTIEYQVKVLFGIELPRQIRVEYNSASISMADLDDVIVGCGGVIEFMKKCVKDKIKSASNKTDLDLRVEHLMSQTVEMKLSKEDLKMLRK